MTYSNLARTEHFILHVTVNEKDMYYLEKKHVMLYLCAMCLCFQFAEENPHIKELLP